MAKKKETAEQKLLKMIEASAGPGAESSKTQKKTVKSQSVLSIIKLANKILIVAVVIAVLFLMNEVKVGIDLLGEKLKFSARRSAVQRTFGIEELIPPVQKLSYYLSSINKRYIFKPYEKKDSKPVEVTKKNRRIVEKTKNLRLVGVSWLDRIDTASVMFEDTEKKVTYFLQKGEELGDIIVKTIYADSAVLGYENEEIIIKYDKK